MVTFGESPVKRIKKTHRGRRSSAGQKKSDQRNEKFYLGAFAFAWLAQKCGTANCNVAPTNYGSVRSIETTKNRRSRWDSCCKPTGQLQRKEERVNRTEACVRNTSQARDNSAARAQEALGADDGRFGFGVFAGYQPENFNAKTLVGVIGLGYFVLGQDDLNENALKKSSNQWRHDLEMRLLWPNWIFDSRNGQVLSWIFYCSRFLARIDSLLHRESVENCLDQQRGWRIWGREACRDFAHAVWRWPLCCSYRFHEAQSRETISDSLKSGCVIAGTGQNSMKEHLLMSTSQCDSWTNFVREMASVEHARKTIAAPTPVDLDVFQVNCPKSGRYGHTVERQNLQGIHIQVESEYVGTIDNKWSVDTNAERQGQQHVKCGRKFEACNPREHQLNTRERCGLNHSFVCVSVCSVSS